MEQTTIAANGDQTRILIVGAGPVGLAAAVFLANKGVRPRIVDKLTAPNELSRALIINSKTLEYFDETEATRAFVENGSKITGLRLHSDYDEMFEGKFSRIDHKYPYLMSQTQEESEQILTRILKHKGICIERGVEVLHAFNKKDCVTCEMKHLGSGEIEKADFDYIYASDGAHSSIRKGIGLSFEGHTYNEKWYLYDLELLTDLDPKTVHVYIFEEGFLQLIPFYSGNIWRCLGNMENILDKLPAKTTAGVTTWQSEFTISYRVIEKFTAGRIYFGGDAAHVNCPANFRGMNLGIEDSYMFAKLYSEKHLGDYHNQRLKATLRTLQRTCDMSDLLRGQNKKSKIFRRIGPYIMSTIYRIAGNNMLKHFLGLEKPLS